MGILQKLADWIDDLANPRPNIATPSYAMTVVPPSIKVPPNSVVLYYRGAANHECVRESFAMGQWVGSHNMDAEIVTPGDGTIRIEFRNDTDVLMFTLAWNDLIRHRQRRPYGGSTGPR